MTLPQLFLLDQLSVIQLSGKDAEIILHNLTTQAVKNMAVGEAVETFITNVKGKMVGHVVVHKDDEVIRLIGPHGQSDQIANHIDRYIIREEVDLSIADDEFSGILMNESSATEVLAKGDTSVRNSEPQSTPSRPTHLMIKDKQVRAIETAWLGERSLLLLVPQKDIAGLSSSLADQWSCVIQTEQAFHQERIPQGFPWYGIDLDESNLPQEADRDSQTICFTKGCYLGQETIARLDAMGQVQKKLVRWKISGGAPTSGTAVESDGKVVGRLTSVASTEKGVFAIGPARRSHFEPGCIASLPQEIDIATTSETNEETGTATVL